MADEHSHQDSEIMTTRREFFAASAAGSSVSSGMPIKMLDRTERKQVCWPGRQDVNRRTRCCQPGKTDLLIGNRLVGPSGQAAIEPLSRLRLYLVCGVEPDRDVAGPGEHHQLA